MFFVKWKGGEKPELVMAEEAYAKAPQVILKWYESQLVWKESEQKKEETVKPEPVDNSQSGKSETEKMDKPALALAKLDNDNSDVSKKEKDMEGGKDDKEKEEKCKEKDSSKEEKEKDSSKGNALANAMAYVSNQEQSAAKSVPDQAPAPVHKYF